MGAYKIKNYAWMNKNYVKIQRERERERAALVFSQCLTRTTYLYYYWQNSCLTFSLLASLCSNYLCLAFSSLLSIRGLSVSNYTVSRTN